MENQLWAPWRGEYITSGSAPRSGCVFCDMLAEAKDAENLILHRTEHAFVVMNLFPYNNGHVLVLPRQHGGSFDTLSSEAHVDLHETLRRTVKAVQTALEPGGFNIGMNLGKAAGAGIPDHLHYHIVPRWAGDTNFMPILGEVKVISQHLRHTYDLLRAQF